MLLQSPESLADLARLGRADAVERLQLAQRRAHQLVEAAERLDDGADDVVGETRHVREGAVPARRHGLVVGRETKTVLGEPRDYLTIRIIASEMTLMVPADATDAAGLRAVITGDDLDAVLALLRGEDEVIAGNWNRRFKHNREKMRTGDVLELVGVIRNLMNRSIEKGLSSGERQMMARAKRILASEIQYAKDLDEAEAQAYLDELLEEIALERETAASRAAK